VDENIEEEVVEKELILSRTLNKKKINLCLLYAGFQNEKNTLRYDPKIKNAIHT